MAALVELAMYGCFRLAELVLCSVPVPWALAGADLLGRAWARLDRRRRARARANLRVAIAGGLGVEDPEATARACFRQLARVPLEMLLFPRLLSRASHVRRLCRYEGAWADLRRDMLAGHGGIVVGGHLGSWELPVWGLRFLPVPARVVVRPIENRWIDRHALETRGGAGTVIQKRGAVREVLATLARGGWVVMMADQDAGRRGSFVPFFSLPASTFATPAVLAERKGVPLYAGACLRRPGRGLQYTLVVRRLSDPPRDLPEAERVRLRLRSVMEALETWIARAPPQYNWIHRRWKTRPPGEPGHAGAPAYARRPIEAGTQVPRTRGPRASDVSGRPG